MKYLLSILLSMNFICSFAGTSVYVNSSDGFFRLSKISMTGKSINMVSRELGYTPEMTYTWDTKDYEETFVFKILSKDIIYILTSKSYGDVISEEHVKRIMQDNNYDYADAYPNYMVEDDLQKGISKKSLTLSFMESALHAHAKDNKLTDNLNHYIYTFADSVLVSYETNDGLIGPAKDYKGDFYFNKIKRNAELYNKTKQEVLDEINMQCKYRNEIQGKYLPRAQTKKYNYNFAILYIDINKPSISLSDFNKIVHKKAQTVKNTENKIIMKYGTSSYVFDKDKMLVDIY